MVSNISLTGRLQLFMRGDTAAADALVREILPKLREIAVRALKRERYIAPLSRTELVNELWVRTLWKGGWQIHDQRHFYALASLAMRRVLIEMARERLALRRGSGETVVSLDESGPIVGTSLDEAERIVEIGILMEKLETKHPDAARIVDMHYFTGFTFDEISRETGLTLKQVRSRWETGIGWLKRALRSQQRDAQASGRETSASKSLTSGLTKEPAT
jgi:RNA polymerase sigma factor (TIGR02999 family)